MELQALTSRVTSSAELSFFATKWFFVYLVVVLSYIIYIVLDLGPLPSLFIFTPFGTSKLFVHLNHRIQPKFAIEYRSNRSRRQHAIVFDAGSTGTRIHVFEFFENNIFNEVTLEAEHFYTVKPGLSSYANNPLEAGTSLIPLLKVANTVIAEDERQKTPIILRATAGLRLLDEYKAESIVSSVKSFLKTAKPSYHVRENSVSILDGESEGIYSWFTVNFLLNLIESPKSVSVLDLGGGSTQVTFAPLRNTTTHHFSHLIKSTIILNKKQDLYTRSYLGYGLMSARKSILQLKLRFYLNYTRKLCNRKDKRFNK
ncbi:ectonucleoside triphosphate diphosphohydrolase 6-like protein [Leptotrombidium deliense]|uniref:Ectonucleoside triphosphate diphosphohydrolase 6-like protein n=1 Tax=Leptotrombidium deliense TaxID=299467 RepID=A0A443S212_9ACAR|nr:ectonucleoside triphosphate diphosphohydrolase 6-like protein [Leptotrombidium deliense]